jgi:hypothetical protein
MAAVNTPIELGTLPPMRSHSGNVGNFARFDSRSDLTITAVSMGAIDVSNAADGSDIIRDIVVGTHPGEDLLGGDDVTWASSDTVFAALIAAKINQKTAEHQYLAFSVTDHVFIIPKNPWAADTGTITVDDESFTASVANMNIEQAFAARVRVLSGAAAGIPDTKVYALGFDHSHYPVDAQAYLGSDLTLDGKAPGRFNLQTASAVELKFKSNQITTWRDFTGASEALAADTYEDPIDVFQWREVPTYIQAAAAAVATYRTRCI